MQRLIRDANNLRWQYKSLHSSKGSIIHVDRENTLVAFRRENGFGEILLIVVHPGDSQFGELRYNLPLGDDPSSWRESSIPRRSITAAKDREDTPAPKLCQMITNFQFRFRRGAC